MEQLSCIPQIISPVNAPADCQHSYFTYCIRVEKRNELALYLREKDIYTTLRFFPLHLNTLFREGQQLPNCEILANTALNIPLHPNLTDSQVEYIIDSIRLFFAN
jgi:aminotransferase